MKNRKVAAVVLLAIAAISLSFTFSNRVKASNKNVETQISQPQEGFVSETRL
ncbi:MAG: hypothetical protein HOP30_19620 [Cyclobacteriaceae bacterium]|nr:hypothetical protein [Cyclobacteriaceae bacterium]